MKFNVHVTIRGPAGIGEFPATGNPLEAKTLASLLVRLAESLPGNEKLGMETVGIRIEPVEISMESVLGSTWYEVWGIEPGNTATVLLYKFPNDRAIAEETAKDLIANGVKEVEIREVYE